MKAECSCRFEFLSKHLDLVTLFFFWSIFVKDHFCDVWVRFLVLRSQVMN